MNKKISSLAVAISIGLIVFGVLLPSSITKVIADDDNGGDSLSQHHRHLNFNYFTGEVRSLSLPKQNRPVRIEVSFTNIFAVQNSQQTGPLGPSLIHNLTVYEPASVGAKTVVLDETTVGLSCGASVGLRSGSVDGTIELFTVIGEDSCSRTIPIKVKVNMWY